jgi:hypothetical protein
MCHRLSRKKLQKVTFILIRQHLRPNHQQVLCMITNAYKMYHQSIYITVFEQKNGDSNCYINVIISDTSDLTRSEQKER